LFIVSNKTNKLFPSDFFDAVGKERNIKTGVLNTKKSTHFIEDLSKTNNATNDSSKSSFLRGPSSPNYINSQFEMIPEVEDEKFNTLYDKNNQKSSKDENSILYMKRNTKFNFNQSINKEENVIANVNNDQLSFRDNQFNNHLLENYNNFNKSNNDKINIKLDNAQPNNSKVRTNSTEEVLLHKDKSPKSINPLKFSVKSFEREIIQTACFSPQRLESKASKHYQKKEIENIMSDGEVYERKKVNDQREKVSKEKTKNYNSQIKVKLPLIKTSRPNINRKIDKKDISNLFDACQEFKKDPEINEKLNELMYKIVDLKNVINSKSNTRFKISSAPSQMKKGSFCDKSSSVNAKDQSDNLTFSKFPNFNENVSTGYNFNEVKTIDTNKMIFNTRNDKINSFNKGTNLKNKSNKSVGNIDNKILNFQERKISKKIIHIKKN
jgi:hypothetical protein